ncbi:alpha/beta hydrolase [Dysgonomonas sp. Marseille-P4677]|uniref:alpha/beta hydrolase n=1 Tax=Dysgonomonas sp. Marseille-P4677 TaxID=2364790 RepID=UPI0019126627|nr:alpha/beta hydrolase [Dysgonomonas sp. Marseille-P4677]MBK5720670.1 alpha/beta hydrolase [Dysgonomonas sp. Marseille-P4677]
MNNYSLRVLLFLLIIFSSDILYSQIKKDSIDEYTFDIYDISRERLIPLAIYSPLQDIKIAGIVIMNHGYGRNEGGSYKTYSAITRKLASKGYFVISIQHELPDDDLLAMDGNLYETRMPNWQRGVENILFTINEIKKIRPDLNWENLNLIGHSNGGDMTMLFATRYPEYTKRAISLDHRRMPIPLQKKPRLYSLRGCDYEADKGVLPSVSDRERYSIRVIQLDDIKHGGMDDKGSVYQLDKINNFILDFLED